jgi:hypothetical protein
MYCTTYTEKSIVVHGETREYKEELKNLGGIWNGKLTNKSTKEQFGGWIFPNSKQEQVKKWLASVTTGVVPSSTPQITPRTRINTPDTSFIERIDMGIKKIDNTIKILEEIPKIVELLKDLSLEFQNLKQEYKSNIEISSMPQSSNDDEEEEGPPPKRLLGKK